MLGLGVGERNLEDVIEDASVSVDLPGDGERDAFNHEGANQHVQMPPPNMGDMGAVGAHLGTGPQLRTELL